MSMTDRIFKTGDMKNSRNYRELTLLISNSKTLIRIIKSIIERNTKLVRDNTVSTKIGKQVRVKLKDVLNLDRCLDTLNKQTN